MITSATLQKIRVLYRAPDTLALYGIPYVMRPGQAPKDLWDVISHTDVLAQARGQYGRRIPVPGPREDWVWLGSPGWWGHLRGEEIARVQAFLKRWDTRVPEGPHGWGVLPLHELKLDRLAEQWPKICSCGRGYSRAEWGALPLGYERSDAFATFEGRHCQCQSTLEVLLKIHDLDAE